MLKRIYRNKRRVCFHLGKTIQENVLIIELSKTICNLSGEK